MDPNELNTKCINKVEEILTARFEALRQRRFAPAAHVNTQESLAATQDKCVKKLVQVTAGALTNEALQLLFVSVQRNNLDLCAFMQLNSLSLPFNCGGNCLEFFPHVWGIRLLFADCQGNSQQTMITTCTSILKRHMIFERFHSVQVGATICMCAQQIFFDGSAKKRTFTSAFEHAAAVFSKKASASGFLDEIEPWVDRRTDDMTNVENNRDDPDLANIAQEVVDMIKKYRPLIFGEAKG
ncbi:hypothetical protein B0H13DRAFT_2060414 [Mycena leptocephala]|nr:hypothetical protein B0H13DRAFT_2060414 [Mycena leptocephala]